MRPIWKGTISFGLVNIPVSLVSASQENKLKFNMLDSQDSSRIRYLRVNEDTGEEVPWERIVKGYEFEDGKYVTLTDDDFREVEAEGTKTIDIASFVDRSAVETIYYDKPYYILPAKGSEKPYVLLRDVLQESATLGIARVVIRTKESLAAVYAFEDALVLHLLHFDEEIRPVADLDLPKNAKVTEKETKLSEQLLKSMIEKWQPDQYHDEYTSKLKAWIKKKVDSGDTVSSEEEADFEMNPTLEAEIMDVLMQSIARQKEGSKKASSMGSKKPSDETEADSSSKKKAAAAKSKSKSSKEKTKA